VLTGTVLTVTVLTGTVCRTGTGTATYSTAVHTALHCCMYSLLHTGALTTSLPSLQGSYRYSRSVYTTSRYNSGVM
jgi:hypothetical protein